MWMILLSHHLRCQLTTQIFRFVALPELCSSLSLILYSPPALSPQIMNVLYHNCPGQRTLLITHSNQALNDLFEKIMQRDIPSRYLLRLGEKCGG